MTPALARILSEGEQFSVKRGTRSLDYQVVVVCRVYEYCCACTKIDVSTGHGLNIHEV